MQKNVLSMIYFALLENVAYGIIAWRGACKNILSPLINLHNRLIKIIQIPTKNFLTINQFYILQSLSLHYDELSKLF